MKRPVWLGGRVGANAYVQGAELRVRVRVIDATLQRAHSFFRLDSLGTDDVRDLEIQSNVLPMMESYVRNVLTDRQERRGGGGDLNVQAAAGRFIDLLIKGTIGP